MAKIISFSLWGSDQLYCVGAVKNAMLAKSIFPEWTCRMYVDHTVPQHYVVQLAAMDNVEVIFNTNPAMCGRYWRFLSMFRNDDDIVISRDTDSRLSERERRCVDEWIGSDKKFSIIKDHHEHYSHLWPISAGMWGMKGRLSDDTLRIMGAFARRKYFTSDQVFLREVVWPIAKDDVLIHGFREVEWMRESRIVPHFIGQGYTEHEQPLFIGEETPTRIIPR
jgi:hypothetical protein